MCAAPPQVEKEKLVRLEGEVRTLEGGLQGERMEREKLEVELGRERDCNRVQLGETVRELKEIKSTLRISQKEKEQLLAEKQKMEQRLDSEGQLKSPLTASETPSRPDSPLSDSEDESPEDMRPPRERSAYSLCDNTAVATETPGFQTPPPSPRQPARRGVVVSQPAPIASHLPAAGTETGSSESVRQADRQTDRQLGMGEADRQTGSSEWVRQTDRQAARNR
ncbi:calcium-binding and coiled-coil domain-containing protein 1-like [Polyodon spathula]|uniref:calcium-binding and coiled-coil domain-containing protein 1-like n=1 Tax=Polyodon spathula TaxID=7913 RepID=UPI001B7E7F3F|nr:calcium-binding and coiled-coil domain-containing protein 1-like [Polyodon spathula]